MWPDRAASAFFVRGFAQNLCPTSHMAKAGNWASGQLCALQPRRAGLCAMTVELFGCWSVYLVSRLSQSGCHLIGLATRSELSRPASATSMYRPWKALSVAVAHWTAGRNGMPQTGPSVRTGWGLGRGLRWCGPRSGWRGWALSSSVHWRRRGWRWHRQGP